jgi:hypothetical protein
MMKIFAVIRTRGSAWRDSRQLEEQPEWNAHARFMDDLAAAGVVALGGPLEGTRDVLLVMRAQTQEEVTKQLAGDPWTELDLLRITRITPWTIRLGRLSSAT